MTLWVYFEDKNVKYLIAFRRRYILTEIVYLLFTLFGLFKVCEKFLKYFFIFKQEDLKVFVSKYS